MKNNKIFILIVSAAIFLCSCSSSDDGGTVVANAATLVFPLKDAECNQGEIVSETESIVTFEWNEAMSAVSYTVSLTNLITNTQENFNSNTTQVAITLQRGVPYSWNVISRVNGSSQIAESETWNFYNAGPGIENYAPFPAELISPPMGLTVSGNTIDLIWKGSDVDNDIKEYEIYMGTDTPPTTLLNTLTDTSIANVQLQSDIVYYWQVITKDHHSNSTKSSVFEFKTD
ncbi:hypothetical protein [Aquimarina sp. RZ0]|uniref:hypothetical protein n=1 Tax=Aquimarina sp. RZ0 TaxID=2607730 RepID=UPI0011F1818D|nr:hypothetical protein [Aquimarina sp. RZ0]KAA1244776.1 hypothetical protein F0000_14920 [Aquimarina sp. RZ0]